MYLSLKSIPTGQITPLHRSNREHGCLPAHVQGSEYDNIDKFEDSQVVNSVIDKAEH